MDVGKCSDRLLRSSSSQMASSPAHLVNVSRQAMLCDPVALLPVEARPEQGGHKKSWRWTHSGATGQGG